MFYLCVCMSESTCGDTYVQRGSLFDKQVCVCVGIKMCVGGWGPGEALQCIILLHLLYSSSPGRQRRRRGRSVGAAAADMTAVELLLLPLAGGAAHSDVFQINPPPSLLLLFYSH